MFNVLTLNKISPNGTSRMGDNYNIGDAVENPEAVLVRSASMHDMEMPESLLAIARCGAGTNNIPSADCAEKGIVVFNTPGANANAVKELVVAGLLLSSRKVVEGIEWEKSLKGNGDAVGKMVEKGKGQFVGPEIMGKTLGVVGLGAIGLLVANAGVALGMKVVGCDPYLSVANAVKLDPRVKVVATQDEVMADCDYLSVHVPLLDSTKGMINADSIAKMKDGVRILNFSRDGLVNSADVLAAVKSGKVAKYVTDFATDDILCEENIICMPHLGASSPESEDNCAVMAADQIMDYLENGNIVNSVNYPAVSMAKSGAVRYCVMFKASDDAVSNITAAISGVAAIEAKTRGAYGYAIVDAADDSSVAAIEAVADVIKVRVI